MKMSWDKCQALLDNTILRLNPNAQPTAPVMIPAYLLWNIQDRLKDKKHGCDGCAVLEALKNDMAKASLQYARAIQKADEAAKTDKDWYDASLMKQNGEVLALQSALIKISEISKSKPVALICAEALK